MEILAFDRLTESLSSQGTFWVRCISILTVSCLTASVSSTPVLRSEVVPKLAQKDALQPSCVLDSLEEL